MIRLMRPYVHPLNVADFKGIRAGIKAADVGAFHRWKRL
jgi:hypothetical protein